MTSQGKSGDAIRLARIGDALEKCRRGSVAVIPFLTPREKKQAERELRVCGALGQAWFWGGYSTAERVCLFLLPDYLLAYLPDGMISPSVTPDDLWFLEEERDLSVSAVRITGSGYRTLSHRDYLGSILGLGLERDALGDVAVQNEREAVVFCPQKIAEFLIENLCKVASDMVKCAPYTPDASFTDGKRYRPINDTVASARLDCVVAALTNLSREDAQNAIRTGLVEVEFEPVERTDHPLDPPLTISVRGYGRFILRSFDGETRKGRLRMKADQLI